MLTLVGLDAVRAFRAGIYRALGRRRDALFELLDAASRGLAADSLPHLSLVAGHPRGHGSVYAALREGTVDGSALRAALAGQPLGHGQAAYGSIINVSSIGAMRLMPGRGMAYQASKAGVIGLTISLAGQLAEKRIRVNCIAPGQVYTPMVEALITTEGREQRRLSGLIQDEGTGWDVGWAAVCLASDELRWVTAQVLVVDAGITATMSGDRGYAKSGR